MRRMRTGSWAPLAPEVVVLDHRMPPGLSGLDLAERLLNGDPRLRVVIYSNYQRVELAEDSGGRDGRAVPAKGNLRALRAAVLAG